MSVISTGKGEYQVSPSRVKITKDDGSLAADGAQMEPCPQPFVSICSTTRLLSPEPQSTELKRSITGG